ncbi:MAG TPA: hypothetical protein VNN74_06655 [Candidatus Micrarchaeia archaeon]|nr:hypothetical protein [Candidatus Micrarchaeia archaeon]
MATNGTQAPGGEEWARYGRALVSGMAEVVGEVSETARPLLLETADYWLSVGLAIGTQLPAAAARLLALIETEERGRAELTADADAFVADALG